MNTILLTFLAVMTLFTALHLGKGFFAPVISAIVLGVVLTPLSEVWARLRVPHVAAAFMSVALAVLVIFAIAVFLEPYVSQAISQGPIIQAELRDTVVELRRLLQGLEQISDDMAGAIEAPGAQTDTAAGPVAMPSVMDALLYAPQFLGQFLIFVGTLYFFLLTQNEVYSWLNDKIEALGKRDLRHAASQVSRYVLTISSINFVFGTLVALAMHILGMPSPTLWGVLAFLMNFVLYLGPIMLMCMLLVAGIVVFDGAISFLPAVIYLSMNATEGQFVTPSLVGKSLSVNPLLVFLSLVFWLWLWGPVGGIVAIPLLIWTLSVFQGASGHATSDAAPTRPRQSET